MIIIDLSYLIVTLIPQFRCYQPKFTTSDSGGGYGKRGVKICLYSLVRPNIIFRHYPTLIYDVKRRRTDQIYGAQNKFLILFFIYTPDDGNDKILRLSKQAFCVSDAPLSRTRCRANRLVRLPK